MGNNTNIVKKCFTYTKKRRKKREGYRKMLKVNSINNVYNTLNKNNIAFRAGVQTNYGLEVASPKDNMVEGNILTGFVGTVAPLFTQIQSRARSIEKGLDETKLNLMA